MSSNIDQIYTNNPASSLQNTDLFYLGRSPYGIGNDMACLFSTLSSAITSGFISTILPFIPGGVVVNVNTNSQTLVPNQTFIVNNGSSLVHFTLPTTAAQGTQIVVVGSSSGQWAIFQNAGQNIMVGASSTTVGTGGTVSSTNRNDNITLYCTVANTTWSSTARTGTLTII